MLKRTECKWGNIDIERPAAAKIVREAVDRISEVFLTDSKGRTVGARQHGPVDRNADFVKITRAGGDSYHIEINVIIRFGVSISSATALVIEAVREDLEKYMDFSPEEIEVHIIGLMARSNAIISRDIRIRG